MLDVDGERRLEKAKFEAGLKEGRSASEAAMQSKRAGVVARLRTQLGENYSKMLPHACCMRDSPESLSRGPPSGKALSYHGPPSGKALSYRGPPSGKALSYHGPPSGKALSYHGPPSEKALSYRGPPSGKPLSTLSPNSWGYTLAYHVSWERQVVQRFKEYDVDGTCRLDLMRLRRFLQTVRPRNIQGTLGPTSPAPGCVTASHLRYKSMLIASVALPAPNYLDCCYCVGGDMDYDMSSEEIQYVLAHLFCRLVETNTDGLVSLEDLMEM
eukprot:1176914-Prorocentrum_minimum.AAC.3